MGDDVFPDRSMALRDKLAWMIETTGWLLEPVGANTATDPPLPGYGYTIGFEQTFGFPEVVIVGLKPVAAKGSPSSSPTCSGAAPRSPSASSSEASTTASSAPGSSPWMWT
ncbi:DUF4262 domain-containing protein [Aquihabitans daechungensis]|uniref:DUF4262 domain-containing protein n=1 Tax=Aquihabitans daechungensis TaxID=1052257 RepID=UPI003B9DCA91